MFLNPVSSSIGGIKFPVMRIPVAKPPGAAPLKPAVAGEDPLLTAARTIAAGLIDPQAAAIQRAAEQRQQAALAQQEGYKGVIGAVGNLTAGIPESIRSAYASAGADTAGYAGSLTGTLGDAARAQAAEAASRIASLGAPGTVAANTEGLNVANYLGGTLPASSLASEAASRLAEAQGLRMATGGTLAQQALQAMQASNREVAELQAKGLDLELTRPAEVQKALLSLREEQRANQELELKRQDLVQQGQAAGAQISSINRAWYQTLDAAAWNRTNATGTLWVVKGDKIVNTGKPAPGSAAGRARTSALVRAADRTAANQRTAAQQAGATTRTKITAASAQTRLDETNRHNTAMEGIAQSKIPISQQQADTAAKREGRMARTAKNGGYSKSQIAKWGDTTGRLAYSAFHGVPNPNYNPEAPTDPTDKNYDPKMIPRYTQKPMEAGEFLRAMLARNVPYSIIYNAIRRYASTPNSWWANALAWQKNWPPGTTAAASTPHGA